MVCGRKGGTALWIASDARDLSHYTQIRLQGEACYSAGTFEAAYRAAVGRIAAGRRVCVARA